MANNVLPTTTTQPVLGDEGVIVYLVGGTDSLTDDELRATPVAVDAAALGPFVFHRTVVGIDPVQLDAVPLTDRRTASVQNSPLNGPSDVVYVGHDNTVLSSGRPLTLGQFLDYDAGPTAEIWVAAVVAVTAGTKASAELTFSGSALTDADTVTIGVRTYTFKTVLSGAANEVLIGAVTASLVNLKAAVNGAAGAGTIYSTGTVAHADVDATILTGTTVLLFEAKLAGIAGNLIAKSEVSTNLLWDAGTTFSGGINPSVGTCEVSWIEGRGP